MARRQQITVSNFWVMVASLGFYALCLVIFFVCFQVFSSTSKKTTLASPVFTVLPAPTQTNTPEISPTEINTPPPSEESSFQVGEIVQIFETGADGLSFRDGPGLNQRIRFVQKDGALFVVKEGPHTMDGYAWYLLEAKEQTSFSGWAVSKYLMPYKDPSQP